MRHLKLFENYLDRKYSQPQYISGEYMRDYHIDDKVVDFSESNFKRLLSLNWNTTYKINLKMVNSIHQFDKLVVVNQSFDGYQYDFTKEKEVYKLGLYLYIEQLDDDWFMVTLNAVSSPSMLFGKKSATGKVLYKCDQWDGLLELLKDEGYIK